MITRGKYTPDTRAKELTQEGERIILDLNFKTPKEIRVRFIIYIVRALNHIIWRLG